MAPAIVVHLSAEKRAKKKAKAQSWHTQSELVTNSAQYIRFYSAGRRDFVAPYRTVAVANESSRPYPVGRLGSQPNRVTLAQPYC